VLSCKHGISGFAARLSAAEAQSIANKPEVVSVFPDPVYQRHTTREEMVLFWLITGQGELQIISWNFQ
jgi:ATP-dependent phosphoenolpyruvate carboxykinase